MAVIRYGEDERTPLWLLAIVTWVRQRFRPCALYRRAGARRFHRPRDSRHA